MCLSACDPESDDGSAPPNGTDTRADQTGETQSFEPASEPRLRPPQAHNLIDPGAQIGPITLGQLWSELATSLGEPSLVFPAGAVALATFERVGLEAMFANPPTDPAVAPRLDPSAYVISVATLAATDVTFFGPAPGLTQSEIEAQLGKATFSLEQIDFYESGCAIQYDDNAIAQRVSVFEAFTQAPNPPPMRHFSASVGVQ